MLRTEPSNNKFIPPIWFRKHNEFEIELIASFIKKQKRRSKSIVFNPFGGEIELFDPNCISTQIGHVSSISMNKSPISPYESSSANAVLRCVYCQRWWLRRLNVSISRAMYFRVHASTQSNQSTGRHDHSPVPYRFFFSVIVVCLGTSNLHLRQLM